MAFKKFLMPFDSPRFDTPSHTFFSLASSSKSVAANVGDITHFCGAMGPSMVAFLKEVYGRAKGADKFLMSQQPALKYSWNTMVASSFETCA